MSKKLGVMDMTAFALALERKLSLVLFNVKTPGNIARVVRGERIGTKIDPSDGQSRLVDDGH
jgi:uridylate kinase